MLLPSLLVALPAVAALLAPPPAPPPDTVKPILAGFTCQLFLQFWLYIHVTLAAEGNLRKVVEMLMFGRAQQLSWPRLICCVS